VRTADPSLVAAAILDAKRTPCPGFRGWYAFSLSTETAYPQRCGKWRCPYCGRFKRAAAQLALARGIEREFAAGRKVRFITLTDASGDMNVAEFTEAWKRLVGRLRTPRKGRRGPGGRWATKPRPAYLRQYAVTIEAHESGALHLHGLLTGDFVPQKWLARQARESGFGKVSWISEVHPGGAAELAGYLAPDVGLDVGSDVEAVVRRMTVARYLTQAEKWGLAPVAARSARRLRPVRLSRGWPGGNLTQAEADLVALMFGDQDRDPGAFELWGESWLCEELEAEQVRRFVERAQAEGR
jgi:hypothetical protein